MGRPLRLDGVKDATGGCSLAVEAPLREPAGVSALWTSEIAVQDLDVNIIPSPEGLKEPVILKGIGYLYLVGHGEVILCDVAGKVRKDVGNRYLLDEHSAGLCNPLPFDENFPPGHEFRLEDTVNVDVPVTRGAGDIEGVGTSEDVATPEEPLPELTESCYDVGSTCIS